MSFTILKNALSFETAHVATDYPYGYTLRTSMFSWIERTNRGSRLVQQTINPKNGRLNAPKKSTYDAYSLLALNEDGHVRVVGYGHHATAENIEGFLKKYSDYMSEQDIKEAQARMRVQNAISKKWQAIEEEVKTKTYKPISELPTGDIIRANELTQYEGEAELYEVALTGYVLKPKCRKEQFEIKKLAYVKREAELTPELAQEVYSKLEAQVKESLALYKAHKMKLTFDKVTYKNKGGEFFHSLSRMLFSSEKISLDV